MNYWGEWEDEGTRNGGGGGGGLSKVECLLGKSTQKVIKINCQCERVPLHLQFLKRLIYHWRL